MARLIFLISFLLFVISSLFAQETTLKAAVTQTVANSALLRADGKSIRINGVAAPSTMTVFPGDRVDTGADTAATIVSAGRVLTLDRNSSAVFRSGTLFLSRGKAWLAEANGSAPGTITRLAAAPVTTPFTTPFAADEPVARWDEGRSKDHFTGICAQFAKACDQAEDACEKKHHRECVCQYHSDHDKDDVSPIHPDADDFRCQPVKDDHDHDKDDHDHDNDDHHDDDQHDKHH
jgi:hypothetical protein